MVYGNLAAHQKIESPISIPFRHVYDLFSSRRHETPDKVFLICPGEHENGFTYRQLDESLASVADFLTSLDLRRGDRLSIVFTNSAEFILIYFAALALGLVVVPINPDLAPPEILFIARNSDSKALLYLADLEVKIEKMRQELPASVRVIRLKRLPDFLPLGGDGRGGRSAISSSNIEPTDEAVIIYTSGTTGNPKGVVLTHLNFLADAKALSEWFCFNRETRTLCVLPLFHNNGQVVTLLSPLYAGGSTVIVQGKASPLAFWGLAEKYGVTWSSVMPSILAILLSLKGERTDRSFQGIICGGQVLTRALQDAFEERFGVPVFEGFGLTETTSFASFNLFPRERRKIGSVGKALPVNEMIIVDKNGAETPAGTEGEILIRGLNIAKEYYNLPERNAAAFRNGWLHSGDYGYRDEEGFFYFRCRKDSLIIKGGENIYPAELENVLFQHPAVAECAVIGIPDPLLGEDLCAFIKLREGSRASERELKTFCEGRIARFKQAKRILIVDDLDDLREIPKGPTRKVLDRVLKEYYMQRFAGKN